MITSTATIQLVRVMTGAAGVFVDDPLPNTAALEALPSWMTSGRRSGVIVWVGAYTAAGARVAGVTARASAYFYHPTSLFYNNNVNTQSWFEGQTYALAVLDQPLRFVGISYQTRMGIRLSNIVDATASASELRIGVQDAGLMSRS